MSTAGPELPPHLLAKRKRQQEEAEAEERAAKTEAEEKQAGSGSRASRSTSPDGAEKRRRVIGPALPPAALDERPTDSSDGDKDGDDDGSSSSSDDEFGPALPPSTESAIKAAREQQLHMARLEAAADTEAKKPKREEWMLAPPKHEDWTTRVDPTKLRNRKFNTGKGAKAPAQGGGEMGSLWTETPEEKRKRLEEEMLGVRGLATQEGAGKERGRPAAATAEDEETKRRIREYNEKNRNTSLYEVAKKSTPREKEDDPSKRAFDREKDIGGGRKIGHVQKKEMLTRAADFGSRFASGSFL